MDAGGRGGEEGLGEKPKVGRKSKVGEKEVPHLVLLRLQSGSGF